MIIVIQGQDSFLLNAQLKQQINELNNQNIVYINNLDDLILEINQLGLFDEKKTYILADINFLSTIESFNKVEEQLEKICLYDQNIILTVNQKLSTASKVKKFLQHTKLIIVDEVNEKFLLQYINNWLVKQNIHVSSEVLRNISSKLVADAGIIEHELSKLISHNLINNDLINELICDYQSENIFDLLKQIINNNYDKAWRIYYNLLVNQYDEHAIIQIMSAQLNKLVMYQLLKYQKYSSDKICEILKINSYSAILNDQLLRYTNLDYLYYLVDKIMELDYKIKLSQIDKTLSFKHFLLKVEKMEN